ncbi:hypothetical protein BaRGS_00025220, partial [Batillaria attramentaria]
GTLGLRYPDTHDEISADAGNKTKPCLLSLVVVWICRAACSPEDHGRRELMLNWAPEAHHESLYGLEHSECLRSA